MKTMLRAFVLLLILCLTAVPALAAGGPSTFKLGECRHIQFPYAGAAIPTGQGDQAGRTLIAVAALLMRHPANEI